MVAQGAEAGGHGDGRGTLPFVPAVVDVAGPCPVLAAGGIGDGRGLAAALVLGAAGAVIGTRFEATPERCYHRGRRPRRSIAAGAADTTRDRVLDIVPDSPWPRRFTAADAAQPVHRRLARDREAAAVDTRAKESSPRGVDRGDLDYLPIWAGEAVDLIAEQDQRRGARRAHRRGGR